MRQQEEIGAVGLSQGLELTRQTNAQNCRAKRNLVSLCLAAVVVLPVSSSTHLGKPSDRTRMAMSPKAVTLRAARFSKLSGAEFRKGC